MKDDTELLRISYEPDGSVGNIEYSERFKQLSQREQEAIINYILSAEDQIIAAERRLVSFVSKREN